MTRKEDDKRGGPDAGNDHNAKVERRFTKTFRAKTEADGTVRPDRMGQDYADNNDGKGFPDQGPA